MTKKVWEKSPEKLIAVFYEIMTLFPTAELRKMFGYPCAFLNGNMFVGLHQKDFIIRLSSTDREHILNQKEGAIFSPMNDRVMKEYAALSEKMIYNNNDRLKELIDRSFHYVTTLPPKTVKKKSSAKAR